MDWLSKFEQEQAQRRQEELAATSRDAWLHQAEVDAFHKVSQRVEGVMQRRIAEIARRTGVRLQLDSGPTNITVRAPQSKGLFPRLDAHRFELSASVSEDSVFVRAVKDDRVDRPGELPYDMSPADWRGSEDWVLSESVRVDDLIGGDLDRLFEWLVRTYTTDISAGVPALPLHERHRPPSPAALRQSAKTAFIVALAGLFLCPFLGPVALVLGLRARPPLVTARLPTGQATAAVILGAWEVIVLIGAITSVLVS